MRSVDSSIKQACDPFMTREVLDLKFKGLGDRIDSLTTAVEKQSSPEVIDRLQTLVVDLGILKADLEKKIAS